MKSLAIIGVSFREADTRTRASLAHAEARRPDDRPTAQLVASGAADAALCLATCSRTEWVVSTRTPELAAQVLRRALGPDAPSHVLRARADAATYVMRLAAGLESPLPGEHAVGQQLFRAFSAEPGDDVLQAGAQRLAALLEQRDRLARPDSGGVATLAVDALEHHGLSSDESVAVLGTGALGQALQAQLRHRVACFPRGRLDAFLQHARHARAVLLATASPIGWVTLPARTTPALVIDVGSPAQLASAPGWTTVGLDELFADAARRAHPLDPQLEALARAEARGLMADLAGAPPPRVMGTVP